MQYAFSISGGEWFAGPAGEGEGHQTTGIRHSWCQHHFQGHKVVHLHLDLIKDSIESTEQIFKYYFHKPLRFLSV